MRIRPSDGKLLDTWTGATNANGIVVAMGRIFVTGFTDPGSLYMIDPTQPAGAVTTLTSSLGTNPNGVAFDGSRIWTANTGSVSIVSLNPTSVTTVSTGFNFPVGMLYDGANIWVTDFTVRSLLKLCSNGSIEQTITVGNTPFHPVFDGTNIWVPNRGSNSVTVVRVKDAVGNPLASAFVLGTLTGNGLNQPYTAAFDGERILVTNFNGNSVSLWKAADLTPLGSFPTGASSAPLGVCSDGLNFWITLNGTNKLARF
jgi:DNA-binding beta-propeller fold protein YncE